jgi:muconate cycloisomerase
MRYYGESPETVEYLIRDVLFPAIVGFDPRNIGAIHARMDQAVKGHPYAKAAVDMACYDLAGKELGVPVSTLLGGRRRQGLEVAHSLGIMEIDAAVDEAEQATHEGITTIKCKTGLDPNRDVLLIQRLRDRLGDEVRIRVDANEGYTSVQEAVEVTQQQEEYGIFLCEQPMQGAKNLARVASRIDTPVMADESAWTAQDILELDTLDAAQCFSCYVTKPGGLYRAHQQAIVADAVGMYYDIGGSVETGIGNAANLQLGVSLNGPVLPSVCPTSRPADAEGPEIAGRYYLDDLITEPLQFVDGMVMAPDGPGLGIDVDLEKLETFTV